MSTRLIRKPYPVLRRMLAAGLVVVLLSASAQAQRSTDPANALDEWRSLIDSAVSAVRGIVFAANSEQRNRAALELEAAALRGSDYAALQLGYAYLTGVHGFPVNLEQSRAWYEMAVRQELGLALFQYGMMLTHGHRFDRDEDRGERMILRAAQLGSAPARMFLVVRLEEQGDKESLDEAAAWRQLMGTQLHSNNGYSEDDVFRQYLIGRGCSTLSDYYATGVFVPADAVLSARYLECIESDFRADALAETASGYAQSGFMWADHAYAKQLYESALAGAGGWGINNYAWLLATSPDAAIRDGERAVSLMEELLSAGRREAAWVDTLAAAYAEAGRFDEAVEMQEEALTLFDRNFDGYDEAVERRNLYASGAAWRD